jgi:hypothetical protein
MPEVDRARYRFSSARGLRGADVSVPLSTVDRFVNAYRRSN